MLIYGKTPKDWKELIGVQSLYYRREIQNSPYALSFKA